MSSYELGYLVGQIGVLLACILLPLAVIGGAIWLAVARSRRATAAPAAYHHPAAGPHPHQPYPPAHPSYPAGAPAHPVPPYQDPYQQHPVAPQPAYDPYQQYPAGPQPAYDPYQQPVAPPSYQAPSGDPSSYRSDPPQSSY